MWPMDMPQNPTCLLLMEGFPMLDKFQKCAYVGYANFLKELATKKTLDVAHGYVTKP